MLFHDLQEQAALKDFVEREDGTPEALESFLLSHYATPHPQAEYLTRVVNNMVAITRDYYFSLPKQKRLSFLKCITNVFKVVFAMKIWELRFSAFDAVKQQASKPLFFASLAELIGPLEAIQKGLQEIDAELPLRRVVLVEGETEEAFIRAVQLRSTVLNFDFAVHVYGGKGTLENLVHYITEKNRQGIRVDLCVDYDGQSQSKSFVEKLSQQSCAIQSVFGFRRDFEASFPPELLHAGLQEYLRIFTKLDPTVVTLPEVEALLASQKPFVLAFEERFGVSVSKPKLGTILGEIVLGAGAIWEGVVNTSSECSEVARFVRFLMLW
jgi:hypothetical protein